MYTAKLKSYIGQRSGPDDEPGTTTRCQDLEIAKWTSRSNLIQISRGPTIAESKDIERALKALDVQSLPPAIQFIAYYFGCEKLAIGIVGIHARSPVAEAYDRRGPSLHRVKSAAAALNLSISTDDLTHLFAGDRDQAVLQAAANQTGTSARLLRNILAHDFGPWHVGQVAKHAAFFVPKMLGFLACASQVLAYQKAHFNRIP